MPNYVHKWLLLKFGQKLFFINGRLFYILEWPFVRFFLLNNANNSMNDLCQYIFEWPFVRIFLLKNANNSPNDLCQFFGLLALKCRQFSEWFTSVCFGVAICPNFVCLKTPTFIGIIYISFLAWPTFLCQFFGIAICPKFFFVKMPIFLRMIYVRFWVVIFPNLFA